MMNFDEQLAIIKGHQKAPPVPVTDIARDLGLRVFSATFPDDMSGMIRHDERAGTYSIFVNAAHHRNRQRFTIAHEIAHFVLHRHLIGDGLTDDALYRSGLSTREEAQANKLAADILMPWHLLEPMISQGVTDIVELARRFEVSTSAMSIRLGVPAAA